MIRLERTGARAAQGVAVVAIAVVASGAAAGEICVQCAQPEATYRCTFTEQGDIADARVAGRAAQLVCITQLARTGGHASCRVRSTKGSFCDGAERVVSIADAADAGSVATAPPAGADPKQSQPGPPQTLAELARRTAASSGSQREKAGATVNDGAQSVGDALGKTWKCLSSLFQSC